MNLNLSIIRRHSRILTAIGIKSLLLTALFAIVFGTPLLKKHFTKGFHPARFELLFSRSPDWVLSIDPSEKEFILKILSQPFYYLDRGAQCYVFESQDGSYVIKIFQENRFATPLSQWKHRIKEKKRELSREQKRTMEFASYLTAYQSARDETALVYLHLNPTEGEFPKLSVKDPIGRSYRLPLDRYSFAIQKKVKSFHKTLLEASLQNDLRRFINSYFVLLKSRISKGIWNEDTSLSSNFGFLENQAIEIDFGHYLQRSEFLQPEFQSQEMDRFTGQLRKFIEANLPDQLSLFEQELAQFVKNSK